MNNKEFNMDKEFMKKHKMNEEEYKTFKIWSEFLCDFISACGLAKEEDRYINVYEGMDKNERQRLINSYVTKINYLNNYMKVEKDELKKSYALKSRQILYDDMKLLPEDMIKEIESRLI